jgi:hypothetical protein
MFSRSATGAAELRGQRARLTAALLAWLVMVTGCSLGNGLPTDLLKLLAAHDLQPQLRAQDGPVRSRAGHLVLAHDAALEQRLVARFGLLPMHQLPPEVGQALAAAGITPGPVLGITGRPAILKLADGAQLEYLFLITTPDGSNSWLFAAYAYG